MRKLLIVMLALGLMVACVEAKDTKLAKDTGKIDKVSQQINEILKKNNMALDARMVITRDGNIPQVMVIPMEKPEKKPEKR